MFIALKMASVRVVVWSSSLGPMCTLLHNYEPHDIPLVEELLWSQGLPLQ